jgi:hypothetical protein
MQILGRKYKIEFQIQQKDYKNNEEKKTDFFREINIQNLA